MKKPVLRAQTIIVSFFLWLLATGTGYPAATQPVVVLNTSMGAITLTLFPDKAPVTVQNFLTYVRDGFYDGLIFHRVINGFMNQGGGFDVTLKQKTPRGPILNEAGNGLSNLRGTVAMARTSVVDSATSQFFINTVDNTFLDHKDNTAANFGYAVFGEVTSGMDVVDAISAVAITNQYAAYGFANLPATPVIITSASMTPAIKGGDVNSSGAVDVFDALLTLQYAVGLHQPSEEVLFKVAADVAPLGTNGKTRGDNTVDVFDALSILRHAVGLDAW